MNITSAKYFPDVEDGIANIKAVIDGVAMTVPADPANRHYAAILEWAKEDGNTIQEAD
jgi:hypothetical protein